MNSRRLLSTTIRILQQLRHDRRTLALVFFMPAILMIVLRFVFNEQSQFFNDISPLLLGVIPFLLMFVVASVAVLRERTSGTLERLLVSPATLSEIILGYAVAFALLAIVQAAIVSLVVLGLLEVTISGSIVSLMVVATLSGVLGMSFGLLFSTFARNEFQAVQFMPAFVFPQFLTCGLFTPRENMAEFLQYFASAMPITYVVDAMTEVGVESGWTSDLTLNVVILSGFVVLALSLGVLSLRRSRG